MNCTIDTGVAPGKRGAELGPLTLRTTSRRRTRGPVQTARTGGPVRRPPREMIKAIKESANDLTSAKVAVFTKTFYRLNARGARHLVAENGGDSTHCLWIGVNKHTSKSVSSVCQASRLAAVCAGSQVVLFVVFFPPGTAVDDEKVATRNAPVVKVWVASEALREALENFTVPPVVRKTPSSLPGIRVEERDARYSFRVQWGYRCLRRLRAALQVQLLQALNADRHSSTANAVIRPVQLATLLNSHPYHRLFTLVLAVHDAFYMRNRRPSSTALQTVRVAVDNSRYDANDVLLDLQLEPHSSRINLDTQPQSVFKSVLSMRAKVGSGARPGTDEFDEDDSRDPAGDGERDSDSGDSDQELESADVIDLSNYVGNMSL